MAKPQAIPTRGVWIVPPERRDTKEPSLRDGDRRKLLGRDNKARRVYQYLVLWDQYPIHDCTWEPARFIPSLKRSEAEFLAECERQGINTRGTVLLPEATEVWNEQGLRRRKMLMAKGIVPAEWWKGDDDPEE